MPPVSLYDVLEVSRTATPDEIKQAYRRIARECHQAGGPAAQVRMRALRVAWRVLSDPDQRLFYDTWGKTPAQAGLDPSMVRQANARNRGIRGSPPPEQTPTDWEPLAAPPEGRVRLGRARGDARSRPRLPGSDED